MGGRGAVSGIERFTGVAFASPTSRSLSADEIKGKVSDKANFILRELEQDEAVQIIIRRSFRGGVPEVSITDDSLKGWSRSRANNVLNSIEAWIKRFERDYKATSRRENAALTRADKQSYRAEKGAISQAQSELKRARKNIKKNYKL